LNQRKEGCLITKNNKRITLGSLFDGIGVFPLAARMNGIVPVWASEIEKGPISITRRHFPDIEHVGDITKIDGAKVSPVNVITFGSPCQDISQVGRREGLAGKKSSLFYQAIRIIEEMREATDGMYPAFAVWENVFGAFSSGNRMDFRAVLESFGNALVPMPPSGRWATAGMVRGNAPDIAWRLMDARYWGSPAPPQRRRRIFLVADFGGKRAAEILFKPRELLANTVVRGAGGMPAAGGDRIPAHKTGRGIPTVHPFQDRRMRGMAKEGDHARFRSSFGRPTDPFPTLLAGTVNVFSLWTGDDYKDGVIRRLTPLECERLQGLPEGWTALGADGKQISDTVRCKALGNSIALPCAGHIMAGIKEALSK
jgi:DNA (cytosine-5)-methyltransferase 1